MKIWVQNSSSKADFSKVCDREGQGRGLGGGAEGGDRELPTVWLRSWKG